MKKTIKVRRDEGCAPTAGSAVRRWAILDDDGETVRNGDVILFSYGIPPVRVFGSVVLLKRELWVLTPGHNPDRCRMAELRDHVGAFYKQNV